MLHCLRLLATVHERNPADCPFTTYWAHVRRSLRDFPRGQTADGAALKVHPCTIRARFAVRANRPLRGLPTRRTALIFAQHVVKGQSAPCRSGWLVLLSKLQKKGVRFCEPDPGF